MVIVMNWITSSILRCHRFRGASVCIPGHTNRSKTLSIFFSLLLIVTLLRKPGRIYRAHQEKHSMELLMSIITSCCTTEACPSAAIVTTPFNHWLYLLITMHKRTRAQLHFIQTFPCSSPGVTCDYPVGLSIWHELMNVRHVWNWLHHECR